MDGSKPYITVRIPYEPGQSLGYAVKREMKTVDDWVLIIDHDIVLGLNPRWYEMCQYAIRLVGDDAGWITCMTNQIGCRLQKEKVEPLDDVKTHYHFQKAMEQFAEHKLDIYDITEDTGKFKLSGLFILTRRRVWDLIIEKYPLRDKYFLGFDNWYNDRLLDQGYRIYLMKGLYVYHGYMRSWNNDFWKEEILGRGFKRKKEREAGLKPTARETGLKPVSTGGDNLMR